MSTLRADSVSPAAGGTSRNLPRGVAAAWAKFNGTGTATVNNSQNVSSLTDNGTGDYSLNWTSPMATAHYTVNNEIAAGSAPSSMRVSVRSSTQYGDASTYQLVGSVRLWCTNYADTTPAADLGAVYNLEFGSLA